VKTLVFKETKIKVPYQMEINNQCSEGVFIKFLQNGYKHNIYSVVLQQKESYLSRYENNLLCWSFNYML